MIWLHSDLAKNAMRAMSTALYKLQLHVDNNNTPFLFVCAFSRVVYKNSWWYDHSFLDRASAAADGPPTYLPTLGMEISVNKPTVDMHRSRDGGHFMFKLRK